MLLLLLESQSFWWHYMRSLSFKIQDLCLHNLIRTLTLFLYDISASYVIQVLMPSDPIPVSRHATFCSFKYEFCQADRSKKSQGKGPLSQRIVNEGLPLLRRRAAALYFIYNQGGFDARYLSDRLQTLSKLLAEALQFPEEDPQCFQFRASAICSSLLL